MSLSVERKLQIITRNLQEVLGGELLKQKLENGEQISLYWGTATTGKPHVAYFVPITKIADFLYADCEVTILLADLHAYLDNLKAPWELLEYRSQYYECLLKTMLEQINVPIDKLKFVRGTSYQLTKQYTLDAYRLCTIATEHDCKKAGAEVVKQVESPFLSGLLYPGLQALDEEYLNVDAQFGGVDQRKIFTFAEKYLPKMGYKKRIHFMNPMVPGLTGDKMSSSDEDSKIDLLDDENSLKAKIRKSFCEEGNIESNGVLSFCKHVIFPIIEFHSTVKIFEIKRSAENGGDIKIDSYQRLEDMFANKLIHPLDLKNATFCHINQILLPIREKFKNDPKLSQLIKQAYPSISKTKKNGMSNNNPSTFVMKCGKVTSVEKHPSLDDIIVATLDLGDSQKVACIKNYGNSSLEDELLNEMVVVITNVKEYNFKGVKVDAQVILAKKDDILAPKNGIVSKSLPLNAPSTANLGESIYFEGFFDGKSDAKILNLNKIKLDKFYDMIEVDDEGHAFFEGAQLVGESGSIISLLKNAKIV